MTDSLHDRIAAHSLRDRITAVQQDHVLGIFRDSEGDACRTRCRCGWFSERFVDVGQGVRWRTTGEDHPEHVADAVIAELGLREEQYRSAACPDDKDYDRVRITTNWTQA